jgi:hypothetical protein
LYKYAIAALRTSVRNGLAHAPKAGIKSTLAPEVIRRLITATPRRTGGFPRAGDPTP